MPKYTGQQEARSVKFFMRMGYPYICAKPGIDAMDMAHQNPLFADRIRIMSEDLASFNNQPIEETIRRLQESITGAAESMHRFTECLKKTLIKLNPRTWWTARTREKTGENTEEDPDGLWS